MDLLTITCDRDFLQVLIQAKSIQKFLQPCRHWIVVNEVGTDRKKWQTELTPYYDKHELKLIFAEDDPLQPRGWFKGWIKQQMWKFIMVKYIKTDYILFDSKCFFIQPTDTSTWTHEGSGIVVDTDTNLSAAKTWEICNYSYSRALNMPMMKKFYSPEDPYVIRSELMQKIINRPDWCDWFFYNFYDHCECILYSNYLNLEGHEFKHTPKHMNFWPGIPWKDLRGSGLSSTALHHQWLDTASVLDKKLAEEFMDELGLLDQETRKIFDENYNRN